MVDPLGVPLDDNTPIEKATDKEVMNFSKPKMFHLSTVYDAMLTNYVLIDSFIGLRKGKKTSNYAH